MAVGCRWCGAKIEDDGSCQHREWCAYQVDHDQPWWSMPLFLTVATVGVLLILYLVNVVFHLWLP